MFKKYNQKKRIFEKIKMRIYENNDIDFYDKNTGKSLCHCTLNIFKNKTYNTLNGKLDFEILSVEMKCSQEISDKIHFKIFNKSGFLKREFVEHSPCNDYAY